MENNAWLEQSVSIQIARRINLIRHQKRGIKKIKNIFIAGSPTCALACSVCIIPSRGVTTNYNMNTDKLHELLRQYFDNTISPSDYIELLEYLRSTDQDIVEQVIDEEMLHLDSGATFSKSQSQSVLNRIKSDPRFTKTEVVSPEERSNIIRFYQRAWFRVAATILVFFSAGLFIVKRYELRNHANNVVAKRSSAPIVPGSQKATLTMANGKVIVLSNAANGLLANTGGSKVVKQGQGRILYTAGNKKVTANEIGYNTLTTPRGGEYQVILPDGSKVWLNAASSITYPTQFTGSDRRVKLTGEAYFEITKNKEKPFYVMMNDAQVRVFGTHFNISAYSDDDIYTTTLLEGSVQVSKNNSVSMLKPGQQAVINHNSDAITVSDANIDDAMAWKNGLFIFNDDNITGIMKKVSRWYDVDVYYAADLNEQKFGGSYHRSKNINELLQYLEMIGKIHFKVQERRITVMK